MFGSLFAIIKNDVNFLFSLVSQYVRETHRNNFLLKDYKENSVFDGVS